MQSTKEEVFGKYNSVTEINLSVVNVKILIIYVFIYFKRFTSIREFIHSFDSSTHCVNLLRLVTRLRLEDGSVNW